MMWCDLNFGFKIHKFMILKLEGPQYMYLAKI